MAKNKKMSFRLNPEWMFKEPVDFEYNKYTLLGYLQKCEQRFDNFEIYPDFIELSLHLANLQSLLKENTLLLTEKKFENCDDEILLKELFSKKPPKLNEEEQEELDKTIKYSTSKVFDAFNLGKSIWNLVYDNIQITLKKNKNNIGSNCGFSVYYEKQDDEIYVWEYSIKKEKNNSASSSKTYMNLIYNGTLKDTSLNDIISENTSWKEKDAYNSLPVFEIKCQDTYPMKETFVPMMKRKIMSYIFQIVNLKKLEGFDQTK